MHYTALSEVLMHYLNIKLSRWGSLEFRVTWVLVWGVHEEHQ